MLNVLDSVRIDRNMKDPSGLLDYRVGNARDTDFEPGSFDRVLITLALHEMPRKLGCGRSDYKFSEIDNDIVAAPNLPLHQFVGDLRQKWDRAVAATGELIVGLDILAA